MKILSQLIDAQLEQSATNPTGRESRLYYNTTTKLIHVYNGATWQPAQLIQEGVWNVGMLLSGGEFKITQRDQTVFTANEFGVVNIQSALTPGKTVQLRLLTDRFKFRDDANATSDILGVEYGITPAIAWADPRPFFVYIVNSNDTDAGLEAFISPDPTLRNSPATANIAYKNSGAPVDMSSPSDIGCLMMTDANTTATHNGKPCLRIGGVRMVMSASTDWTVQTITNAKGDGIQKEPYKDIMFLYPQNQNGAVANSHILANAGTEPTWASDSSDSYRYTIGVDGRCQINHSTINSGASNNNGATAVNIELTVPYEFNGYIGTNRQFHRDCGHANVAGFSPGLLRMFTTAGHFVGTKSVSLLGLNAAGTVSSSFQNDDFVSANDELNFDFNYKAFGGDGT